MIWYISGRRVTFIGILISLHSRTTSSHYDTQAHSKCSSLNTCLLLNAHFQSNSRTPRTLSFKSFSIVNMRSGNVLATPSFVEISNRKLCTVCKASKRKHIVYLKNRKIIIRMALHEQVFVVVYSTVFVRLWMWQNLRQAVWRNQARSKTPRIHYQFLSLYHLSISFSSLYLNESSANELLRSILSLCVCMKASMRRAKKN